MLKRLDPKVSVVLVMSLAFMAATASAQVPYGSFTQLEYHQIIDQSITSIEGFCYGGGYVWAISLGGVLIKIDPAGSVVSKIDILTTDCHGGICYDNGTLWVVTDESQILPFDTAGNSLGSGVDFSGLPDPFTGSFGDVYGAVKDGDGFWLYNFWVPMIFKVDMSGNVVRQYPNSWLDQGLSTIAKIGNKIYKLTYNDSRSNQWWDYYEALAVDVETGEVTDSWEYPNDSPQPKGLSAGDGFLWALEFDVFDNAIGIRKLSVPDPLPPPDIPSAQWGDFTIIKWGYPPVSPPMLNGLYALGYDQATDRIWLGTGYEQLWASSYVGTRNFPLIGTWDSNFNAEPRDIAFYNDDMWLLEHYNTIAAKMVGQVESIGNPVQFSREWEAGMGKIDGLATNGTYIWVSGRENYQSSGDPMNTIRKYDLDGDLVATFQYPETTNYEDLAWHRGGLWAIHMSTTSFSAQIHKIDIDDGTVLATYQTGWASNPDDNIQGTLASNGESLLTFAALSSGGESYQNSHLRLIEIQLPSDQISLKVDFNEDGQEDILWRYYGLGGYNRAWFLGNTEQAGITLAAGESRLYPLGPAGQSTAKGSLSKFPGSTRDLGIISNRLKKPSMKSSRNVMGTLNRRVASVSDPRKAGRITSRPSQMSIADPRYVKLGLAPKASSDDHALISAAALLGGADLMPVGDLNWQIVGTGDFDNDTHVDILWRNLSSGANVVWLMDGTEWDGSAELIQVPDLSWQIVGTGDFDNDTHVDILWRNSLQRRERRLVHERDDLDGERRPSRGIRPELADRRALGTSTRTGMSTSSGATTGPGATTSSGTLNEATWTGSAELIPVGDPTWQIAGTGDYNSDGNIDILWRYNGAGGYNVIWYMNGVAWSESAELLPVPDLTWRIVSR